MKGQAVWGKCKATNAVVESDMVLEFEKHDNTDRVFFNVRVKINDKEIGIEEFEHDAMNRTAHVFGVERDIKGNEEEFLEILLTEATYVNHHYEDNGFVHYHIEGVERSEVKVLEKCSMNEYFKEKK